MRVLVVIYFLGAVAFVGYENSQLLLFVGKLLGQFLLVFFVGVCLWQIRFDRAQHGLESLAYFRIRLADCHIVQLLSM